MPYIVIDWETSGGLTLNPRNPTMASPLFPRKWHVDPSTWLVIIRPRDQPSTDQPTPCSNADDIWTFCTYLVSRVHKSPGETDLTISSSHEKQVRAQFASIQPGFWLHSLLFCITSHSVVLCLFSHAKYTVKHVHIVTSSQERGSLLWMTTMK